MRIWLVPSAYAPRTGGIETVTRSLGLALARAGHEITVLTHQDPLDALPFERLDGLDVHRLRWGIPRANPHHIAAYLRDVRRSTHALRGLPVPDVINVHGASNQMIPLGRFARAARVPFVLATHGEVVADPRQMFQRSTFMRVTLRRTCTSASALVAPSRWTCESAGRVATAFRAATVIPNGIDADRFRVGPPPVTPTFAAYGRHEHQKGYDLLVRAWPLVRRQVPEARLLLAGAGSETERLRALASDGVDFLGALSGSGVLDILRSARVVVVPSRVEAFGMTALEALAAGRALVHSGRGGLPEATGGLGIVADPEDPEALATAMVNALAPDPPDAREHLRALSWDMIAARYLSVYEQILPTPTVA
ncbi:glycosyltransferase family 4 protein [Humibacter sp.]|uniref:glycosyltransferase family 4 protein n=1 Tax=Humibacter sp. TaxID=1940291 RepID=UPI002C6B5BA9|nr:glycosyltransferase family 4 protein [Humibacter sp.]HVX07919.1 glycosyltransferase family 4 protein [Humibacter sp.]